MSNARPLDSGEEIVEIVTLGIDFAKNIFAMYGIDASGQVVLQHPAVKRANLLELTTSLTPRRIGMEARFGAHHWRERWRGKVMMCDNGAEVSLQIEVRLSVSI